MGNPRARPLCPGPPPTPPFPDLESGARDGREGCQVPGGELFEDHKLSWFWRGHCCCTIADDFDGDVDGDDRGELLLHDKEALLRRAHTEVREEARETGDIR